ncbi:taurine catabolism dioxygenase TauD [Chromatiales bacterium (ex Bugula neritina AB1)]|nr:taurine catabolism dioxygenase TauD [Chromatiales bacterium (ex Bugula neritina AB1)]
MATSTLPPLMEGPAAWIGADIAQRENEWMVHLTPADIADLEQAAHHYLTLGRDVGQITAADFPLKTFAPHLQLLKQKLLSGVGFEVLRGLPIAEYSQEFYATVFCGIGAHLGSARSQNAAGHILGHVRDIGASAADPNARIYQTSERQSFHTDSADVVGLICIKAAKEGGESLLVSALSIFNRMRKECPELLTLLFEPVATDRRGEIPQGARPYFEIPPLNWHKGFLTVLYQRQYIDSAQRFDDVLPLTAEKIDALNAFDAMANDPHMHLSMQLQPGDMQFVYNHTQLHDRTGFTDWPEPENRRHLMRLWLSIEGDRPLPECFRQRYGSIEVGDRGGIVTENTTLCAPLD